MQVKLSQSDRLDEGVFTVHILDRGEERENIPTSAASDARKEALILYRDEERRGLVTIGDGGDRLEELRIAGAAAASLAHRVEAADVALDAGDREADHVAALVEGFILGAYCFGDYKAEKGHVIASLAVLSDSGEELEAAVNQAHIRAEGTCLARDLVNRSPHEKTAPLLAEAVQAMADHAGLRCEVWDRARIEKERMGGLLAVNRGSVQDPRFVVLEHAPEGATNEKPIVLVGKAIVFDTGGLSLKPTKGSMDHMKADMAGGAAVVGAMYAAALLRLPLRIVALIPMTDNRPGGDAYVPGDVVTMRSGLHVEVLNTDAEGRMILADALDYAREFSPALVIDVATLTGAAVVALGDRVGALMTPDDDGAEERLRPLVAAGRRTGEFVHPMPMNSFFADSLKTDVADLKNVGSREGGAISAAKFLERFTHDAKGQAAYPWMHIDIAGPAFTDSPQPYRGKGGTGFGARLLIEALREIAAR